MSQPLARTGDRSGDCPLHVAIIMDGNGRWAVRRGLGRTAGHRRGVDAARRVLEAAPRLGVGILTLYAFSSDNWRRPRAEVVALMGLFLDYLERESRRCVEEGIRLTVLGRRERLSDELRRAIERAEAATAGGGRFELRIALDYSSRDAILRAVARCARGALPSREDFARSLYDHCAGGRPGVHCDVDLLIRTGGEQRLSDFLLWECAYAELYFTDTMWPDFGAAELGVAIDEFRRRQRRFGGLPGPREVASTAAAG